MAQGKILEQEVSPRPPCMLTGAQRPSRRPHASPVGWPAAARTSTIIVGRDIGGRMRLLEIKEILRQWLRGRAKKLIARRLGVDVKTVRKYVRVAEEYGLTREVRMAPTAHVVLAVATKMCDQEVGRPRGEGWKRCSRHRERVRNLLDQRITVSEIRSALGRLGVRVSASVTVHAL